MKKIAPVACALMLPACANLQLGDLHATAEPYEDPVASPAPSSARPAASPLPVVDIPFERTVLPNGLTLVVHEDHKAPIVAVSIWYHVGSKDEKPGKTGFAHLFEHLMFQGSENFKDEFFKPFEKAGATDMNGTTWLDRTNYFENVPTTALDMALWMESDRMGHLLGAIDQKLLDEQRGVVQNEKRQGENQPYGKVMESLLRASFPEGHPYHHTTIGSMEDLNAASLADVKEWFRQYYGAANVTLVLAGDITPAAARDKAQKYFGDIPPGPPVVRRVQWVAPRAEDTRDTLQDRVAQVRVMHSWNVPRAAAADADLLDLVAEILGGSSASRLDARLVHRDRIADRVGAGVQAYELASLFTVDADVKQGTDPAKVEAALQEELQRLIDHGPTAEELERARTTHAAGFIRGIERIGGFSGKAAVLAACQVYEGDPACYRRELATIAAATPRSVQQAARRWLSQGRHTLVVEPYPPYLAGPAGADRKSVPAIPKFPDLSFPALQRAKLKNGMPVVLAERHDVPLVQMQFLFDAGYAADQGRKLGTSSFTMAMLAEGTTSLPSLALKARTEQLGWSWSAGSGLDSSYVGVSLLKARLKESLPLLADVLLHPAFDAGEMERLRGQWLAGIAQEKTDPESLAERVLPPLLYGEGHAYAIPFTGSGTPESIRSLAVDDLRAFQRDWLRPDNATLLVVGDTTLKELLPLLDEQFGAWRASGERSRKNVAPVAPPPAARVYLMDKPDAEQTVILAGLVAPSSRAPNHLEIATMNGVLGGTFTSRINMNLREDKHWSYGAHSGLPGAVGQRPFLINAPVQTDRTAESLKEIAREIADFTAARPPTADEIARIKAKDVRQLPGRFETGAAVMGALAGIVLYERPDDYVQTLKARTEAQTEDAVRRAAKEVVLPQQLTWVIIGDLAKIETGVRALRLGEVRVLDADGRPVR
ncbi:MAG TPA: pitrilysin family protein [Candidatus Binatia bacterium]|nr:pitrilysin family protein [Candidatus Binatia bacterium]